MLKEANHSCKLSDMKLCVIIDRNFSSSTACVSNSKDIVQLMRIKSIFS